MAFQTVKWYRYQPEEGGSRLRIARVNGIEDGKMFQIDVQTAAGILRASSSRSCLASVGNIGQLEGRLLGSARNVPGMMSVARL